MTNVSMSISKKFFDENKVEWLKQGETDGFEEPTYSIELTDLGLNESSVESGDIYLSGISDEKSNINISIWHELDLDLAGEVLEYYVKKVNKIKTILEAAK